ncbi:hypothetical protein A2U01_0118114, partial [Trifolium medium]|nr:hypothetical protein [Trifolium medium]
MFLRTRCVVGQDEVQMTCIVEPRIELKHDLNGHDELVVLKVELVVELSWADDGAHGRVELG